MITVQHARTMARYNEWQNRSLYAAADTIDDVARRLDRGAFFRSIHGTLSHLMWGDRQWMSRFAGTEKPVASGKESPNAYPDWAALKRERASFDEVIVDWTRGLDQAWLEGDVRWYSGLARAELQKPAWFLVTHFFNHQTHHRGQVHAMLTAAGATPEDTDLMLMAI